VSDNGASRAPLNRVKGYRHDYGTIMIIVKQRRHLCAVVRSRPGYTCRLLGERINDSILGGLVLTEILGTKNEIQLTWKCKPEMRKKIVRFMLKKCGHSGVRALAKVLDKGYNELYEIGGLEGRINRRNCQRRQRRKRQLNKLLEYNIEISYEKEFVASGGGKRGKGGGLQDAGKRAIMQSIYG